MIIFLPNSKSPITTWQGESAVGGVVGVGVDVGVVVDVAVGVDVSVMLAVAGLVVGLGPNIALTAKKAKANNRITSTTFQKSAT